MNHTGGYFDRNCFDRKHTKKMAYSTQALRSVLQSINRTPALASNVWTTLKQLGINKSPRWKRSGVTNRRKAQTLTSRAISQECSTGFSTNVNKDLLQGHDQKIPVITGMNRSSHQYNNKNSINFSNLINIPITKDKSFYSKSMNFGLLNARSVKANDRADEINEFISDHSLDICTITETWLSSCNEKEKVVCGELTPSGYTLLHTPREQGRGGGVAVVLKSSISTKAEKTNFNSFESMAIMCKTSPSCTRLIVLYRPPSHSKAEFLDEFRDYMDTHVTTAGRLLVVGDFNLHMDDKKDNDAIRFKELLHSLNLQQHITCPTHKQVHTLDLLTTRSSDDLVSHPIVYASSMSDHCPITCKLHIKKVEVEKKTISFRKTRDINIQHLTDDLQKCDLTSKDDNNIDEIVTDYNNALSNIMDKHAPIITKEVCVRTRKPWYNDQIAQAKRERRTTERKWIKTKDPDDLKAVHLHRDKVTQLCSDAKKQFYQRKISDSSTDQKALFQIANELL